MGCKTTKRGYIINYIKRPDGKYEVSVVDHNGIHCLNWVICTEEELNEIIENYS